MIRNYFKIAWRNLLKHTSFSVINILGLSIGLAACLLIFIYVQHERSYDLYNSKADRIARVTMTIKTPDTDIVGALTPAALAGTLKQDYPEVEAVARFLPEYTVVKYKEDFIVENDFLFSDQAAFSVFDFGFVEGSVSSALTKPNTVVLTETVAKKYFGGKRCLGETMVCNNERYLVTGVVKDRPANSDLKINAIFYRDFSKYHGWVEDFPFYSFVLFRQTTDLKKFEQKLMQVSKKYIQPELDAIGAVAYKGILKVEPLSAIHFSAGKLGDTEKGNPQYPALFSILALLILLIALMNYINLSTARSAERAREVGIRKVSGAPQLQLIGQFLFESMLLIGIAWLLSIAFVRLSLPVFNRLLQTTLVVNWQQALVFTGGILLLTVLLAGLYPALVLSRFQPVKVLKGNWKNSGKGIALRKIVTVTQFAIAAGLIMSTTVIYQQLHFMEKRDLGFNKEQLLNIKLPRDSAYMGAVKAFQQALRQRPEVAGITVGSGITEDGLSIGTAFAEKDGKKMEVMSTYMQIDPDFLNVFGISLAEGRNISDSFSTDKTAAFLVNEAFVKKMGWKTALGREMQGMQHKGKVVGVVKNFYYKSLHNMIEPVTLVYNLNPANTTSIKVKPAALPMIKTEFKKYISDRPMNYSFFDEIIEKQYEKDRTSMSLFNYFTIFGIFISCLGLYGLVALITIQRTREIGVRKVLGASVRQLVGLMSSDFLKLVSISLLIALPVAGILMNRWLTDYAYHIQISWWMYLIPVSIVFFVALAVISKEVVKTAIANPVKSLRTE